MAIVDCCLLLVCLSKSFIYLTKTCWLQVARHYVQNTCVVCIMCSSLISFLTFYRKPLVLCGRCSVAQFTETLQLSLLRPWSGLSSAQHVAYWRLKISISNFTSFWYPLSNIDWSFCWTIFHARVYKYFLSIPNNGCRGWEL